MAEGDAPKIQIDSDWKAQAQAEKEKLREQAKKKQEAAAQQAAAGNATAAATGQPGAAAGATPGAQGAAGNPGSQSGQAAQGQRQMPPATFETLISTTATQALFALGAIPDPRTGQRVAHPEMARHHIDMLTIIEEKTEGNLSEEEKNTLAQTLHELRQRYIQVATQARHQTYS